MLGLRATNRQPGPNGPQVSAEEDAPTALRFPPTQHAGLWEHALAVLRSAIVRGELAPGTRLVEWELAERLGVSRGPVRDALVRLEQERLVANYPRRGTFVLGVSADDVREFFGLRILHEEYAASLAVPRVTDEDLRELRGYLDAIAERAASGVAEAPVDPDLQFHRAIVRLSGNRRLLHHWDMHIGPLRALLALAAEIRPRGVTDARDWHSAILAAIEARDAAAAGRAIREHLSNTQTRLVAAIEGAGPGDAGV